MTKQFTKRQPLAPAKELYELLTAIGWTNAQLSRDPEVDVTQNTVSRWLNRWTPVPPRVLALLRHRAANPIEAKKRRKAA